MQAAILVGLAMAVLWFLEKLGGTPMVIRPIVVSPVIGALLGDLQTGVMVGATLELVFMGAIQIGAAVPPDVLVGAGLGTAFAIQSGQGADIALALALPIAILAQSLKVIVFIIRSWFMDLAMKLAEAGDIKKLYALNIGGLLLLPAVGFALLLLPMMEKRNAIYFVFGFILISYLNLPIMAVTIMGVVLAFVICYEKGASGNGTAAAAAVSSEEEEDLFDE